MDINRKIESLTKELFEVKDHINSESINKETPGIIRRFDNAVKFVREEIDKPRQVDRSFNTEFKIKDYTQKANIKQKKKPGPKPKK